MHSILEIKRSTSEWNTIIFPTLDLPLDGLEDEEICNILRLICQELSGYMPGELFMPHEVADVVIGSFDRGDFNDNKWNDIVEMVYDIVTGFADIMFSVMKEYSNITLLEVDDVSIKVQFQTSPKENF